MDVTKPTATGKLCVPKLLVIDDEPEICALITETFSGEFEVASASDGTSGIRAAIQNRPDLVLVDLRMPGMDGIEVCKVLRENFSALETSPLLMVMTGRDDAEVASFQSGADDFVAKPFGLEQLRARIHARLRARLRSRLSTRQVHGNLEIDSERLEARIHGELIELSSLEFRLLHYFMQTNG
ncbi:MAG: response regulator transcription factor, partial [Oligoflexia bacterium]